MFWVGEVEAAASTSGADVAKFWHGCGFHFFLIIIFSLSGRGYCALITQGGVC